MQPNKVIKGVTYPEKKYNATTGDMEPLGEPIEVSLMVNLTSTSNEWQELLYGGLKTNSLTIRTSQNISNYDYYLINGIKYTLDNRKTYKRGNSSYFVSEV